MEFLHNSYWGEPGDTHESLFHCRVISRISILETLPIPLIEISIWRQRELLRYCYLFNRFPSLSSQANFLIFSSLHLFVFKLCRLFAVEQQGWAKSKAAGLGTLVNCSECLNNYSSGGPGPTEMKEREWVSIQLNSCLLSTYCAITVLEPYTENAKINMTKPLPLRMS